MSMESKEPKATVNYLVNNSLNFDLEKLTDQMKDRGFKLEHDTKSLLVVEVEYRPFNDSSRMKKDIIFTAQTGKKPVTADTLYEYPKTKVAPIQDSYRDFIRSMPESESNTRLVLNMIKVENGKGVSGTITVTNVAEERSRVEQEGKYPARETKSIESIGKEQKKKSITENLGKE